MRDIQWRPVDSSGEGSRKTITIWNSSGHQWKLENLGKSVSRSEERSHEGGTPARPVPQGTEDLGEDEKGRRRMGQEGHEEKGECWQVESV